MFFGEGVTKIGLSVFVVRSYVVFSQCCEMGFFVLFGAFFGRNGVVFGQKGALFGRFGACLVFSLKMRVGKDPHRVGWRLTAAGGEVP